MCGIYGYIGEKKNVSFLLDALEKLEYRGYDSCGICYYDTDYNIKKKVGNVAALKESCLEGEFTLAIGHTRWATHGEVSQINAHPHHYGEYIIVHNGVIENYNELKEKYCNEEFYSETDTEVIAHLLNKFSIKELFSLLEGNFALLIVNKKEQGKIHFMKRNCPLLLCRENGNTFFSSDLIVFPPSSKAMILCDGSYGFVTEKELFLDNIYGRKNMCYFTVPQIDLHQRTKEHLFFEILEQPKILRLLIEKYNLLNDSIFNKIKASKKIFFIGCGSSFYAANYLALFYTKYYHKESYAVVASEFETDSYVFDLETLFVYLSQSGETADLIHCYNKVKNQPSILLTNVISSTLARNIMDVCYIYAYPELSVASTKAFTATIFTGLIIGAKSCKVEIDFDKVIQSVESIIANHKGIEEVAKKLINMKQIFVLGSGLLYPLSLEFALKLREVSYLSCWGLASGELKHGTIALVDENCLAFGFDELPLKEMASRGCNVIVPEVNMESRGAELAFVVYAQLLTYYTAKMLLRNVDQPKNLAKSVTVK